jgi:flagellar hook-associated protein 1 FlgK
MSSSFFGLDMALRALQAQQTGIDVTGHNVANANTDGYSRQNVRIATTEPYTDPAMNRPTTAGQLGTGSIAKDIQRARDAFLDTQYRTEDGGLHNALARQDALEQVETVLDEPAGVGISSLLNNFYSNLNQLANDPSDLPTRTNVTEQAISLTQSFNRISGQLTSIQQGLDNEVVGDVNEINQLTKQIVQYNKTITQVEFNGQNANDLRDQRDSAIDRLSQLVQTSVSEIPKGSANAGSVTITLGSQVLVDGSTNTQVDLGTTTSVTNPPFLDVTFGPAPASPLATLGNAEIAAKIKVRDTDIGGSGSGYLAQLDTIASNLITAVNTIHAAGFDLNGNPGGAFFTGTNAATIGVNAAIQADPRLIAASGTAGTTGNNSAILQIAGLRNSMAAAIPPLAANTPTSLTAYNSLIADLGTNTQSARSDSDVQNSLVTLLTQRRQSLSGVSLDEEATNMIRYQRAYEAAARLLTANDEMLDKLINGTGVVGRG